MPGLSGKTESVPQDPERELITKYLTQWILKEKSERHTSMIQSQIRSAKFRRVQTVENFDFRHSKTKEKIEKTYLQLHANVARDNLPSAVFTGHDHSTMKINNRVFLKQ
mgnify:CR=1 FL=1